MKLSIRTQYGTRALIYVAAHTHDNTPVSVKEIARKENIPVAFLQQLITSLISSGLIYSVRGRYGGVKLKKAASEICLKEIIEAFEGPVIPASCIQDDGSCIRASSCAAQDVWNRLKFAIDDVLSSTTLQDLKDQQMNFDNKCGMYYI